jgi:hypothetical protein
LGWGTGQARRLSDQISRERRKDKHDDERHQETLSRHDFGMFRERMLKREIDTKVRLTVYRKITNYVKFLKFLGLGNEFVV